MPRTDAGVPPDWLGPRHRRVLAWTAMGGVLTGGCAGLSVACLALGARLWAAGFGLATLAAVPLLGLGPALDWWWHRRPHRLRHRARPGHFPGR